MPIAENVSPVAKATKGISRESGLETSPKAATTAKTMMPPMRLLVAPHRSSPAMTSSMLIGVEMIASNVFWKYMRTKEPYVHSKNEEYMMVMATRAGAMNWMNVPGIPVTNCPSPRPKAAR